jgi:putative redox protein
MAQEDVKAAVMKSIEAVRANPKAAKIFFKANTELVEDVRCSAQVRSFSPMIIDDRPELGGKNAGPNPVELLLVALGTCQEIMYSAYASVMGIHLDSVKVDLKGDIDLNGMLGLDEKTPAGFTKISFKTNIESNADEETLMNLIEAVEKHCPVMDTILRDVTISGSAAVNGKELFRSETKKVGVQ